MLVSVVIPAYNCIDSLENTVNSILQSGLTNYEILLIDDGSLDGTSDLCDALQHRCHRIRCIHQENAGVSQARNRGIREARGTYILFFDADDTVEANGLASAEALLLGHDPDMLIFGMCFDYYFRGTRYRSDSMVSPLEGLLPEAQWKPEFPRLFASNALSPVWNKFIRKELLDEQDILFPGGMIEMEDFLFSVRCLRHCNAVYFLPEAIYHYRQSENEQSTFRRLCRIPSITEYMRPFAEELTAFPGGAEISGSIYENFFYEMVRFSGPERLRQVAEDMLRGVYAPRIAAQNPRLYRLLASGKYRRVWLERQGKRLRHWAAIWVKYLRNGGKN